MIFTTLHMLCTLILIKRSQSFQKFWPDASYTKSCLNLTALAICHLYASGSAAILTLSRIIIQLWSKYQTADINIVTLPQHRNRSKRWAKGTNCLSNVAAKGAKCITHQISQIIANLYVLLPLLGQRVVDCTHLYFLKLHSGFILHLLHAWSNISIVRLHCLVNMRIARAFNL